MSHSTATPPAGRRHLVGAWLGRNSQRLSDAGWGLVLAAVAIFAGGTVWEHRAELTDVELWGLVGVLCVVAAVVVDQLANALRPHRAHDIMTPEHAADLCPWCLVQVVRHELDGRGLLGEDETVLDGVALTLADLDATRALLDSYAHRLAELEPATDWRGLAHAARVEEPAGLDVIRQRLVEAAR